MPVNILHLHSSFALGGKEARAVRLMNAFGTAARHTIVSGVADAYGARERIAPGIAYEIAQSPPPLAGRPSVARYEAIARYMRRFDLVLTYNWGAINGAMARRVFAKRQPPLIHHEDGFNADEAAGLKRERNMFRRLALPAAHALVVPSLSLERVAREVWRQPSSRIRRIANGIDVAAYAGKPDRSLLPGLTTDRKAIVIGTIAALRPVKNLTALVRACGGLSGRFQLVIVGEGPDRPIVAQAAAAMGIGDRLLMPGHVATPEKVVGAFDIMALSSLSEQAPIAVIEGMAAGLPIATMPVGDVPAMIAPENLPFVASGPDEIFLRDAIQKLMRDPALRTSVGAANRAKAAAEFDATTMIDHYRALYEQALGRPGALAA